MEFPLVLALRAVQGVFAVIILGLSASVIQWYNDDTLTSPPAPVSFMIFVPLFSMVSCVYLEITPKFLPKYLHPWAVLGFEVINVIFYFAGFVAMAVFLNNLVYCRGAVCASARAATVFASFNFVLWGVTAGLAIKGTFNGMFASLLARRTGANSGATDQSPQMKEAV